LVALKAAGIQPGGLSPVFPLAAAAQTQTLTATNHVHGKTILKI